MGHTPYPKQAKTMLSHTFCNVLKMAPNSVCCPVEIVTPVPRPEIRMTKKKFVKVPSGCVTIYIPFLTKVPINAIDVRSPNGAPNHEGSAVFSTAFDSPVNDDSSTSRSNAVIKRTSEGIRSPTVNETISPGRSSLARTVVVRESLEGKWMNETFIFDSTSKKGSIAHRSR